MKKMILTLFLALCMILAGCTQNASKHQAGLNIIAVESFLADIVQNVVGDLHVVHSLIPAGVDPHSFELTPKDVAAIEDSDVVFINGGGLEYWLNPILAEMDNELILVSCSEGLADRTSKSDPGGESDPHFWLDPLSVIHYVENIRAALSRLDPSNESQYAKNADRYINKLNTLHAWITEKVAEVPQPDRLLVTNHETLGYFADRYGFTILGTILVSATSSSMPSASDLSELSQIIRENNVKVLFLEVDENPQLADQLSSDLGIQVVTSLYTHSLSSSGGPASNYIAMMEYDVRQITEALK